MPGLEAPLGPPTEPRQRGYPDLPLTQSSESEQRYHVNGSGGNPAPADRSSSAETSVNQPQAAPSSASRNGAGHTTPEAGQQAAVPEQGSGAEPPAPVPDSSAYRGIPGYFAYYPPVPQERYWYNLYHPHWDGSYAPQTDTFYWDGTGTDDYDADDSQQTDQKGPNTQQQGSRR